jgi:2-isopropylmalate synthase
MKSDTVKIFDTTLRDGEQSPGCSMDLDEKLRMARQLAKLGVDIIEAGFPIASKGDFAAVERIAGEIEGPVIAGLSRAKAQDIDRCWEAVKNATKPRIHTFLATSDLHMKHKLQMSREEVLKNAIEAVKHARNYTQDVEFSPEDATRSDWKFLAEVVEAVIAAGAATVNIPDTVGYTAPEEFYKLIRFLKETVPNIENATISVHCHNDLGLGVANSLAAIQAGARQVECTINGIGERAGNASMEEIVMTLKVRKELFKVDTHIKTEQIYHTSKLLSLITGVRVQPNKAIVGDNAFAHEAGIHQDGVLKNVLTYEIMTPESVGWVQNKLVLGKHSGRHALRSRLIELGYNLPEAEFEKIFESFKALADRKKEVFDDDLEVLVFEQKDDRHDRYVLKDFKITSAHGQKAHAQLTVVIDGKERTGTDTGDGPVEAAFKVMKAISGFNGVVSNFNIAAITGGADAQGEVSVHLKENGREVRGMGTDTDIIKASLKAYINALNRFDQFKEKRRGI